MASAKKINKDSLLGQRNREQFDEAYSHGHRLYVEKEKRNSDFYRGEQWDPRDRKRLENEGRPCLTLNLVLSTVNAIIGEQLDRKVEAVFSADATGNVNTANALNKITRCILKSCNFDEVEEDVFADGIIGSRGYYDVRMSFANNINGDISISHEDPIDVIIDNEAKEADPTTWNRVFVSRWMTVDQIEDEYGSQLLDSVLANVENGDYGDSHVEYHDRTFGGEESTYNEEEEEKRVKRLRVVEQQFYRPSKMLHFVDPRTGDLRAVPSGAKAEQAEAFADEYGLGLIERKGRRVRVTVSVVDILLSDDWSIYRSFTIIPFFPYFRRGNPFSPVDNLIDPQNLLNKTSSQELHIVNTTANSGWIIEEGSLLDMDASDLEERGAETGLVLQFRRGSAEPKKIQPNQIPTGIDRISQKAANTIREVSSVNAAMLGTARADQSGRAQDASTARGQVQISVTLANLRRARRGVLNKILELVQDFYSDTRYFSIVGDSVMRMENDMDADVGINMPDDDGNILNDVTVGRYNVEVGYRSSGATQQQREFDEVTRLRELNVQIPDHVMVQYSTLEKRMEISDFLKNSQGFGEPTPEQDMLSDLQMEHQIGMLKREIEMMDAEIQVALATAREKTAKADTMEGYNQAQMELRKLEQDRAIKERELALRIALAARSHQTANAQNDKRIASQIAMKSMDMSIAKDKPKPPKK